jgi:hypothetical protein
MGKHEIIARLDMILDILPRDRNALVIEQRYSSYGEQPKSWTALLESRKLIEDLRAELLQPEAKKGTNA